MNGTKSYNKLNGLLIIIIMVGALLRLGFVFYVEKTGNYPLGEGRFFIELAKNIAAGKGMMLSRDFFHIDQSIPEWKQLVLEEFQRFGYMGVVQPDTPTSFAEPVVPLCLAGFFILFGESILIPRILLVMLSTFMIYMVYRLGTSLDNRKSGTIAAAVSAVYPPFIYYTGGIVTQLPFTFLFLCFILAWIRFEKNATVKNAVLTGFIAGIAMLTRADILLLVPVLMILSFVKNRKLNPLIWMTLAFILTMTPWIIRNYVVQGNAIFLPTKGGRNLWESNNYKFSEQFSRGEHPAEIKLYGSIREKESAGLKRKDLIEFPHFNLESEITRDNILVTRVKHFIIANPIVYIKLCYVRLKETIRIIPRQMNNIKVVVVACVTDGWILPLGFLGFFLTLKSWSKYWIVHISVMYQIGVHVMTTSGISQRIPVMPLIIFYAAHTITLIMDRRRQKTVRPGDHG